MLIVKKCEPFDSFKIGDIFGLLNQHLGLFGLHLLVNPVPSVPNDPEVFRSGIPLDESWLSLAKPCHRSLHLPGEKLIQHFIILTEF
jgi:hypothetical protein